MRRVTVDIAPISASFDPSWHFTCTVPTSSRFDSSLHLERIASRVDAASRRAAGPITVGESHSKWACLARNAASEFPISFSWEREATRNCSWFRPNRWQFAKISSGETTLSNGQVLCEEIVIWFLIISRGNTYFIWACSSSTNEMAFCGPSLNGLRSRAASLPAVSPIDNLKYNDPIVIASGVIAYKY